MFLVRRLAPDYSPPMSDKSPFEYVNQIQSQSRGNSASHGYTRSKYKSIEASCSKALLDFVNKKLNLDCV